MLRLSVQRRLAACILVLLATASPSWAADLRRAAPPDAFMAVYARHNPERDFQQAYYAEAWKTVQEERLPERLAEIITARISADDRERAAQIIAELKAATAPIHGSPLPQCEEVLYAQTMDFPFQEQLFCVRTNTVAAKNFAQSLENLFKLAEKHSDGKVKLKKSQHGELELLSLELPLEVPGNSKLEPTCAVRGDLFVLASSPTVVRGVFERLDAKEPKSKFDDPRVQQSLAKLPEFEDTLTIFDGQKYFEQLRKLPETIRKQSGDNPDSQKAMAILDKVLGQLEIVNLIVTVEFTDQQQLKSASYGTLSPGADQRVLYRMLASGKQFDDWRRWVPEEATSFSLSTGVSLHPLYDWTTQLLREVSPDAQQGLERWEELQKEAGVHLDKDILQSFSGEAISVTTAGGEGNEDQGSVVLLRCHQPERIRALLHQGIEKLGELPPFAAQQIELQEVEGLEGFEQLTVPSLAGFGVKPLVGFVDGWMVVGSRRKSIELVLATKSAQHKTFAEGERFAQFGLDVNGPVAAISYSDLAGQTRSTAQLLRHVGMFGPSALAMAGQGEAAAPAKVAGELLGLLPSVAKIIEKLGFSEARLSVTQSAQEAGAWTTKSVTLVRKAQDDDDSDDETK